MWRRLLECMNTLRPENRTDLYELAHGPVAPATSRGSIVCSYTATSRVAISRRFLITVGSLARLGFPVGFEISSSDLAPTPAIQMQNEKE